MNRRLGGRLLGCLGVLASLVGIGVAPTAAWGQTPEQWAILNSTNQERARHGQGPLAFNAFLNVSAQGYADQLAAGIPFSHTGPDGRSPFDRMTQAGYRNGTMGENIARGWPDVPAVMNAWFNSPGHEANIVYPGYHEIGIGVAGFATNGTKSWVQDFGGGIPSGGGGSIVPPPAPIPMPIPTPIPVPTGGGTVGPGGRIIPSPVPVPVPVPVRLPTIIVISAGIVYNGKFIPFAYLDAYH